MSNNFSTSSKIGKRPSPFALLIIAIILTFSIFSLGIFFISAGIAIFPTDQSNKPISYHYGETTKQKVIYGLNASILRTKLEYKLVTSDGTSYISSDGKCSVLVNDGQTPDSYNKTGNDETATVALLKKYLRKNTPSSPVDKNFQYISNQGATGSVPMKYSTSPINVNGATEYAGVYARVISAGGGVTVTITIICETPEQLSSAASALEKNVYFWNEEASY